MSKYRYYIIDADGDVEGTNDADLVAAAMEGDYDVLDTATARLSGSGEWEDVYEADRNDYIDDEGDDEGEEG